MLERHRPARIATRPRNLEQRFEPVRDGQRAVASRQPDRGRGDALRDGVQVGEIVGRGAAAADVEHAPPALPNDETPQVFEAGPTFMQPGQVLRASIVRATACVGRNPGHNVSVSGFVDVHSHMIPSGDDGVRSVAEGLELLREAARRGTTVQYGTPHANQAHPLTPTRRARTEAAHAAMALETSTFGLELRLGWELAPEAWLLDVDPTAYRLDGLRAALLEFPLPHTRAADLSLLTDCVAHLESAGLVPVLAHPERSRPVQEALHLAAAFRERGCLLQLNASSLLGQDENRSRVAGLALLRDGLCDLVGSDAHRRGRPPYLDAAYALVSDLVGRESADRLLGGEALLALDEAQTATSST